MFLIWNDYTSQTLEIERPIYRIT